MAKKKKAKKKIEVNDMSASLNVLGQRRRLPGFREAPHGAS